MKRVAMTGPKTSVIVDCQDVKPNDDQIMVKTKYVGVCMSEHYDWSTAKEGDAFGHEPMGVVVEVGKNVTGFKVGDRVSGAWGGALPGSGGMTEYSLANPLRDIVVKIPDNVRDEDAVIEPLACLVSAVSKVKLNVPGTAVCVVGAGYMGCGAISLLKLRGAYVTAVDMRPESLANAKKYGADAVYSVEEAWERFVDKENALSGKGFDVVMEWGENDESLDLAINLTNMCGALYVGAYHTGGKRMIDMQMLNVKAADCLSVHPREWELLRVSAQNAVKMIADGTWCYAGVPTRIYPMNQFDRAHAELETKYGHYMKALIDMTQADGEPYTV